MRLFLIRHGEAESFAPDFDRILTKHGIKSLKNSFHFLEYDLRNIEVIISSPLKRAVQTAKILKKFSSKNCKLIEDYGISPGNPTEKLIEMANALESGTAAFVGHMPDIAQHCSELTSASGVRLMFQPGTIAVIDFNGEIRLGSGTLTALIK